MTVTDLPAVNAALNATSFLLLVSGYLMIRNRRTAGHRACMIAALAASVLFLASYLVYHYHAGSTPFTGTGPVRAVYFGVLISHTILAVAIVPLVLMTVVRAHKGRFGPHKAIARWTLPLWLYVSVTGVLVYFMLYQWYPSGPVEALQGR